MNNFETEARQLWGDTKAYKEHIQKNKSYSKDELEQASNGLILIFGKFAKCKDSENLPDSRIAKNLVKELQNHITEHFYTCTDEILAGLGQMYVSDERFARNIDKCGEGTAKFVSDSIKAHIKINGECS